MQNKRKRRQIKMKHKRTAIEIPNTVNIFRNQLQTPEDIKLSQMCFPFHSTILYALSAVWRKIC